MRWNGRFASSQFLFKIFFSSSFYLFFFLFCVHLVEMTNKHHTQEPDKIYLSVGILSNMRVNFGNICGKNYNLVQDIDI